MNDLQRLLMTTLVIIATIFSSALVVQQWFSLQFLTPAMLPSNTVPNGTQTDSVISISATPTRTPTPQITISTTVNPTPLKPSPTRTPPPSPTAVLKTAPTKTANTLVNNLLPDFSNIANIKEKKNAFFNYMSPMIEEENAKILADRARIKALSMSDTISESDHLWLDGLQKRYRVKDTVNNIYEALLLKVNIIPPSLAIAQSANESAWAGSRFARLGNNLFGQWCFSKGCGVIPEGRPEGETFEVRQFKSPQHSVASYLLNLNRHYAYAKLREVRFELIQSNRAINGYDLAVGLESYSTRKMEYVKEIQQMIKYNKLLRLDVGEEVYSTWDYFAHSAPTLEVTAKKVVAMPSKKPKHQEEDSQ